MKADFYRARRRKLLEFMAHIRAKMLEGGSEENAQIDRSNIGAIRYELSLLRLEFHANEKLAWAPMTYTPRKRPNAA